MKQMMRVFVGALLVASSVPLQAAEPTDPLPLYVPGDRSALDVDMVVKRYQPCLDCSNNGVMESTLGHIVWLRLMRPDADLEDLVRGVERLVTSGPTGSIRYRAFLAAMVLDSPSIFKELGTQTFDGGEELFECIAKTANASFLGRTGGSNDVAALHAAH